MLYIACCTEQSRLPAMACEESPNTSIAIWSRVAGNARLSQDTRCEQRRPSRNAEASFGMSLIGNNEGETAKSLPVCKAVSALGGRVA